MEWIAGYVQDIEIVVVLRRQDRLAVSRFSSNLRAGNPDIESIFADESRRLFTVAPAERALDDLQNFYDYQRLLDRFSQAAQRCRVTTRLRTLLYDPPNRAHDPVAEFLALLGLNPADVPVSDQYHRLNPALGDLAQRVVAKVNKRLAYQRADGAFNSHRRALVHKIEEKIKGPARAVDRQSAMAFYQRFSESNEAVRRRYFPQADSLFDEDFERYPETLDEAQQASARRRAKWLARYYLLGGGGLWLQGHAGRIWRVLQTRLYRRLYRLASRGLRGVKRLYRACTLRLGGFSSRIQAPAWPWQQAQATQHFTIARIIGNDLPPRQAKGQSLRNLRYILENEPNFQNCEKVFVLNRLLDPAEEASACAMIEAAGHRVLRREFSCQDYRALRLDRGSLERQPQITSDAFLALPKTEQFYRFFQLCRAKIAYAFDINGARNVALAYGQKNGDWSFVFDGACFLGERAAQRLFDDARRSAGRPYLIVPMRRLVDVADIAQANCQPNWREEPQIGFHRSAKATFDTRFIYGLQDKTSLLTALGVPGRWQHWRVKPGMPKIEAVSGERFRFKRASASVFRLPSRDGSAPLEQAQASSQRHNQRNVAVLCALDRLDALCDVPPEERVGHLLDLPRQDDEEPNKGYTTGSAV